MQVQTIHTSHSPVVRISNGAQEQLGNSPYLNTLKTFTTAALTIAGSTLLTKGSLDIHNSRANPDQVDNPAQKITEAIGFVISGSAMLTWAGFFLTLKLRSIFKARQASPASENTQSPHGNNDHIALIIRPNQ